MRIHIKTSKKYFILNVGMEKRTETRIGTEGICITHSCIHCILCMHITDKYIAHSGDAGMAITDTLNPNSCFCSFFHPYI